MAVFLSAPHSTLYAAPPSPREAHSYPGKKARLGGPAPLRGCRNLAPTEKLKGHGQKGGAGAARVGPAPTSGRGPPPTSGTAALGASEEVPPPAEGPGGRRSGHVPASSLSPPGRPGPRARFRVRPRDLPRDSPAWGVAGSGGGLSGLQARPCPASPVPAGQFVPPGVPARLPGRLLCHGHVPLAVEERRSLQSWGGVACSGQGHWACPSAYLSSKDTPPCR